MEEYSVVMIYFDNGYQMRQAIRSVGMARK